MNVKKYFTFKGRINRKKYLFYQFIITITHIISFAYMSDSSILSILSGIIKLILTFVIFTKIVQRLHDINTSAIVLLIPAILMIVGEITDIDIFAMIVFGFHCHLMIKKGTYGPNKYGNDPLSPATEYVTLLNEIR